MQGHGTDFNLTQQPTKPGPWTGSKNENKNWKRWIVLNRNVYLRFPLKFSQFYYSELLFSISPIQSWIQIVAIQITALVDPLIFNHRITHKNVQDYDSCHTMTAIEFVMHSFLLPTSHASNCFGINLVLLSQLRWDTWCYSEQGRSDSQSIERVVHIQHEPSGGPTNPQASQKNLRNLSKKGKR